MAPARARPAPCHDRAVPRPERPDGGQPARRAVLRLGLGLGLGAVASTALAACGIRLEDDAPRLPGVPRRTPIPQEAFLLALWRHSAALGERAAGLGGPASGLPARLAALHEEQAKVLRAELARLGVPEEVLDGDTSTASASGTTTPGSTTTTSPATATAGPTTTNATAALAAEQASDLGPTAISSLAQVPQDAVPLVGAVLAQRSAAATLLGSPATWPEATLEDSALMAAYLGSTRSAVYAFEVVTAQSGTGAQRTLAARTLSALRARASAQEAMAGTAADPPPLAYPLPFTVTTPAAARRLAVHVLTALRRAVARDLGTAGVDTAALALLVQWLGETEVLASRWGVALEPFPGLE